MTGDGIVGRAVIELPSPNRDARPGGGPVDTLVLHYTGMISAEAVLARLTDPNAKVSAHWCIGEDGALWRMVPEHRRAWHAGVSRWRGRCSVNDHSIGVELVNPGHEFGYRAFPRAQMDVLIGLVQAIAVRHPIDPRNVVAHSDIAPLRRKDPGELFDWARLARAGIGLWPVNGVETAGRRLALRRGDRGVAVRRQQERLRGFGYDIAADGDFGAATEAVVRAFQRHFRQRRIDGVIDADTAAVLRHMADRAERLDGAAAEA